MTIIGTVVLMPDDPRRPYGSGSLYPRTDKSGRESWYGQWWVNGRQVKRKVGPKRPEGTRDGLTKTQAEAALRKMIEETVTPARTGEHLTVEEVSLRYRLHAERRGRKRSTLEDIESHTRIHLTPFFGAKGMDTIRPVDVSDFVTVLERRKLAAKTIRNVIGTLSALFNFAKTPQRRWATMNPCEGLDLPAASGESEIRFLKLTEVAALISHTRPGMFHHLDRAMYLTAAMTGLRQGELVALRWIDVDWPAARIRVRQNYVRGEFGSPKSKRSTRSVPMADEVAGELDRLHQASRFQADDDLVFAHPQMGEPIGRQNITRRMKKALKAAGMDHREYVFHDLRHTFGTTMAASGKVPIRTLQEWMGHRDLKTTLIYADYAESSEEAGMIEAAFGRGNVRGTVASVTERIEPS